MLACQHCFPSSQPVAATRCLHQSCVTRVGPEHWHRKVYALALAHTRTLAPSQSTSHVVVVQPWFLSDSLFHCSQACSLADVRRRRPCHTMPQRQTTAPHQRYHTDTPTHSYRTATATPNTPEWRRWVWSLCRCVSAAAWRFGSVVVVWRWWQWRCDGMVVACAISVWWCVWRRGGVVAVGRCYRTAPPPPAPAPAPPAPPPPPPPPLRHRHRHRHRRAAPLQRHALGRG